MQVKILRILDSPRVEVETSLGIMTSTLKGSFNIGESLDVELDLDDDFIWGENIVLSDISENSIYSRSGSTILVALLESINSDNTAVLRLGSSCILIDVKSLPADLEGKHVVLTASMVSMHPTNI